MKIVILTNAQQYPAHHKQASFIQAALKQEHQYPNVVNIGDFTYDHQCLNTLKDYEPDVLITLDLAGFRFRTQSGENALNMLYTKNLNLICGNRPEYAPLLRKKISLSMIFYDISGKDNSLPQFYPNMLYYHPAVLTSCEDFLQIWHDFTRQALLSEASD